MQAGLSRFGADFGNGQADSLFFPLDESAPGQIAAKARVLERYPSVNAGSVETEDERRALEAARSWMTRTLRREGHRVDAATGVERLGAQLAEDFVVLRQSPSGDDRTLWVHVCSPSGWRPERILGKSFLEIHAPVPAFGAVARGAAGLVEAMVTRGPYVRFVWTVAADDQLDHHPDHAGRAAWTPGTARGFLRVERQVTVPLPAERAAVFIIRTYLYPFEQLSAEQRATLAGALRLMPDEILRYKQLHAALPRALELLAE